MNLDDLLGQLWPSTVEAARHYTNTTSNELATMAGKATANLGARVLAKLVRRRDNGQPDEELDTAARDVEQNPGDVDFENTFRGKLKKALRDANSDLLAELAAECAAPGSMTSGLRSVSGIVTNSTVITGDNNRV